MKQESSVEPLSGYLALLIASALLGGAIAGFAYEIIWLGIILMLSFILMIPGFTVVYPNGSCVMVLFGAYQGTIRENGFFWVNPFLTKKPLSLKIRNFETGSQIQHEVKNAAGQVTTQASRTQARPVR